MWQSTEFTDVPEEVLKRKESITIDKKTVKVKVMKMIRKDTKGLITPSVYVCVFLYHSM